MSGLVADQILTAAYATTGFRDFGPDEFRTPLRVLGSDLEGAALTDALRDKLVRYITANLERRLRLLARRESNPRIAAEVIDHPVFVIGLPRTGTSALVDLMAQDPAARAPMQWEIKQLENLSDRAT